MTARDPHATHPVDPVGDPLTFAVSGLMGEPPGTVFEYDIPAVHVDLDEDLRTTEPVTGRMRLTRTNRGLIVDARIHTSLAGECSRCLRPIVTPVDARIDEEVLPSIDLGTGQPVPPEEDGDLEVARLTDHWELELRPLVAAAVSLEEPIAPLCEPDCPGLCPECGERMAPGHGHGEPPIDPRLEALLAFRVDGDAESG
ncbi:MAG TPA: YceD family protein [Candidatus Limnocylindrales bacterium]|jgi:uncharacterized protein|nr:YceD family protein [Candidatus Limnocylindrales bacterium]